MPRVLAALAIAVLLVASTADAQEDPTTKAAAYLQAQTLLTQANSMAGSSISDAQILARRAKHEASDEVLRQKKNDLDPRTSDMLKGLRSRVETLILELDGRYKHFESEYRTARELADERRPQAALNHLARLREDAPTRDPKLPFERLRNEAEAARARFDVLVAQSRTAENISSYLRAADLLEEASDIDRDETSGLKVQIERLRSEHEAANPKDYSVVWLGLLASGLTGLGGVAVDATIEEKVKAMNELQPGEAAEWNQLYDEAQGLVKPREILYQIAAGVAVTSVLVGVVKAIRRSTNLGGTFRPGQRASRFLLQVSSDPNRPVAQIAFQF